VSILGYGNLMALEAKVTSGRLCLKVQYTLVDYMNIVKCVAYAKRAWLLSAKTVG